MDSAALARERAELRGRLAATHEQIHELQGSLAADARRQQALAGSSGRPRAGGESERGGGGGDDRVAQLQAELVEALRDNELLRLALGSGPAEPQSPRVGHRTVSSTQLASASSSALTVQQRREVAVMVRRQENLRKAQAESFQELVLLRERERDAAIHKLSDAEHRLAESVADLKRLEQVRLQDNREAATDLESWEHERRALNARVEELTAMLKHRPWVLDEQSLPGPVPGHLSPAPFAGASSRRADESPDAWRAVLVDDGNNRVDELRGKLAEMQHETDVAVQRAAGTDEAAYQWFVRAHQSSSADRDSLSAEVALLHSHIASRDRRDDIDGTKLDLLLERIAAHLDVNFLRFRLVRIFALWARLAANGKTMRDSFAHLFRGLSKGPTHKVMSGLAKRMRDKTSINMFKVITGLTLRLFRRPPFRAPFSAWAHAASRNRLLWRRSSRLIFATIQSKLRCMIRAWHCILVRKNRNAALLSRRQSVIAFQVVTQAFLDWSKGVQTASKIMFFNRRSRKSHRKTVILNYFTPWRQYANKHRVLKQGWRSLKATRQYKSLLRPFKGWHVIGMSRSPRVLVDDYLAHATAVPESAGMLHPALQCRRVWSLDSTVQLGQLVIFTCRRMRLRRNFDICRANMRICCLLRSIQAWRHRIWLKFMVKRFSLARQVRAAARMCASAFWTWAMQHPRRLNLLQLSTGVKVSVPHEPEHVALQRHDGDAKLDAAGNVSLADQSLSMHSSKFLQSLVPLKSAHMYSSEQGTKHMYFVWKTVLAQFESRLMRTLHAKQCRKVFDSWLDYQTRKSSMHRKRTVFQLRWFQTPILIIWTRWNSWTHERRCRRHVLAVCVRRRCIALQFQVMYAWNDQHLLNLNTSKIKHAAEKRLALRMLLAALTQWTVAKRKAAVLAMAGKRIVKRTERHLLQKAFLHFLIGIEVHANQIMRPWTRSTVIESAKEHCMFGVIEDNSHEARVTFLQRRTFTFWFQLTKRRMYIAARCHHAMYTWPQLCAFRAWSSFARIKHKMLEGLGESHARHVHAVMDRCYDIIKAWGWFTRVRRNVKTQLQNHVRRITRYTLRPLVQFWSAYVLTRRALFYTAVGHLRRKYRQLSHAVLDCWHEYARLHGWKKRKANKLLARIEIRRGKVWLNNAMRFWEAYAVSRMTLAIRAATLVDLGDAKHCKSLLQNTLQAWQMFNVSRKLVFDLTCRCHARHLKRRVATWRQYLWLQQIKTGVRAKYCAALVQKLCSTWVIYTRHKARLARKGVLVMQRSEQLAMARAFDGLRHCMVTAEIASQYRTCLKDIEVSSCSGHAFRVWLKYLRQCSVQASYQAACLKRRVLAFLTSSLREWWVRAGRTRRVRMILHTIHMLNRHLLRRCSYLWRRSARETRIRHAQRVKTMIREAHCLCYIVFRLWEQRVHTLLMDINVRIVAIEEDQLRLSLSVWWKWCTFRRNQRVRRGGIHERRETQILNQSFRTWCHYVSRRHRERRRKRLDVYVHAQHGRITQTGGLAYKLTSRVLNVLKARASARRYLFEINRRQQLKRDRVMLYNSFYGLQEFLGLRNSWSATLFQLDCRRSFAMCRWALTGWYSRWQQKRSIVLATLWAEKYARNRIRSQFLRQWWNLAIREAHLKSSHEFRHLTWVAVQNDRRHCSNLCDRFFEIWYASKCARARHYSRICKAIAWSNVHTCSRICKAWSQVSAQHKRSRVRQLQITARNFRNCLRAVLSEWITAYDVSKSVQKQRRRCLTSWLRGVKVIVFNGWNSHNRKRHSQSIAYSRVHDAHAQNLCVQVFLSWAEEVHLCRGIQDAFGVVKSTFDGIYERKMFGRWLFQARRSMFLRNSGCKLKSRCEVRRKMRLYIDVLSTLQQSVKNRKLSELRAFDDTLLDYKYRAARVMRMVFLRRLASRLLHRWAEFQRHGPSSQLFITKLEPEWVLVQVWLRIAAEQPPQHALELRSRLQEECLLAIRHAYRLTSTGRDALDAAIQILNVDIQKKVAVVKIGRVDTMWSASPVSIANNMVRVLSDRQATVSQEDAPIQVDRAQVCQSFFVRLHRWWFIRGRRLLRAWSALGVIRRRFRFQELVRTQKLQTRKARVTLGLWLDYAQHQSRRHALLVGALTATLRRLLLRCIRCWRRTCKAACVAEHTFKRAVAKGRVAVQHPFFSAWYWFCDQRRGKEDVTRIVIEEWSSAQTRVQRKLFSGWRQCAHDRVALARSVHLMSERVLVRLDTHVMRRALVSWRAHTKGTLAGRWRNFGLGQISHAVHVNKLMIVDRFILQSMRFSFIRWAMRTVQNRPLERLVVSQVKRHSKALLTLAFDVLCDLRARHYYRNLAILTHDKRKRTRAWFCVLEHWKLASRYWRQTAAFFVGELRLRKISKVLRGWFLVLKAQDRLGFFVVKNRRRLSYKMIWLWKELLCRQDRLVESLAHRLHANTHRRTVQVVESWRHVAFYLQRNRVLFDAVAARDNRRRWHIFVHAWRQRVKQQRRIINVVSLLQMRRTRRMLRKGLRAMHIALKHPPMLRRAILLVVGQMNASRYRHLALRIFGSWHVRTGVSKVLAVNAARILQSSQKRRLVQCVNLWLYAVDTSASRWEANQVQDHMEALQQARDRELEMLLEELQASQTTAAQQLALAKEEALQSRLEAAEVVAACKADAAQLVDSVEQQAAQLEALQIRVGTQEDELKQMASNLEIERQNVAMRDSWLHNLGTEMDNKDVVLRKERERTKSLEQMIQAYEREFKSLHDSASSGAGSGRLRDKSMHDYSHASRQALGRPQESARSLEPRLQLSARSSRSSEKENTGPCDI